MSLDRARQRPGGRTAQVRKAVMTATLELLAEYAPENLSFSAVAARAGVHETSIYRRWGTRERLAIDALTEYSSELIPMPDTGSIRGDLVALGRSLADYGATPLGQAMLRILASGTEDALAAVVRIEFWTTRYDESQTLVARAQARGELRRDIDGRLLLESFIAPIHFRLLLTHWPIDVTFLESMADVAVSGVSAITPTLTRTRSTPAAARVPSPAPTPSSGCPPCKSS